MKLADPHNRAALAGVIERLENALADAERRRESGPLRLSVEASLRDGVVVQLDVVAPLAVVARGRLVG